jgi:hypothetical protein
MSSKALKSYIEELALCTIPFKGIYTVLALDDNKNYTL